MTVVTSLDDLTAEQRQGLERIIEHQRAAQAIWRRLFPDGIPVWACDLTAERRT